MVHLELTEAGNRAASVLPELLSGVQNAHLAGFSQEEFETMKSYLRRILKNAETIAAHAQAS